MFWYPLLWVAYLWGGPHLRFNIAFGLIGCYIYVTFEDLTEKVIIQIIQLSSAVGSGLIGIGLA